MIGLGAWSKCDDCGTIAVSNRQDIATFLGVTRRAGWARVDPGWHFCPTCSAARQLEVGGFEQHPKDPHRSTPSPRQLAGLFTNRKATP